MALQFVLVWTFFPFSTIDRIEGESILGSLRPPPDPQFVFVIGIANAILCNFAATFFFSLWAARREFFIATAIVLAPNLLWIIIQFSLTGTIWVVVYWQENLSSLAINLIFCILAASLARRHRLRREARAEQAIIETF